MTWKQIRILLKMSKTKIVERLAQALEIESKGQTQEKRQRHSTASTWTLSAQERRGRGNQR